MEEEKMKKEGEKSFSIEVNGKKIAVKEGLLLNALKDSGFDIPHLCFDDDFKPLANCRLCIVEADGKIAASCNTPVRDGMKIRTDTDEIREARRHNLELILSNHPLDCDYCYKNLHCELQRLAEKITKSTRYMGAKRQYGKDESSSSLSRNMEQCILCGRCIEACEKQGINILNYHLRGFSTIVAPAFNSKIADTPCISCGQCALHCPTAAIIEKDERSDVYKALNDEKKFVIAQIAPSVRSSIGEEFGMKPGSIATKKIVSALRQIGFDSVMDTSTGADFTIMEEATELVKRLKDRRDGKKAALPMFTSCCPAWVNYVEAFHPELIENLSTSKSPYQMLGSVIKTYYAKKMGLWDGDIVVIAIMPCTAKKQEAKRVEHRIGKVPAVDHVLTVREAAKMIRESGIELSKIPDDDFDQLIPTASGSGQIFGASGGVMEASLRTAEYILTGETKKEMLKLDEVRGMKGIKKAEYKIGKDTVHVAVVNGSGNVENLLSMIKKGEIYADFVEVMACPGGCVGGGGQPIPTSGNLIAERARGLYSIDEKSEIRCAHENPALNSAYDSFFGEPGKENAEKFLHTSYHAKKKYNFKEN